jgi:hypothetical protein
MRAYVLFALVGWILIGISFLIGLLVLAPTAADYFGGNAKAIRDAAEAGSALLAQLNVLQYTPRWLEPLAFVGVASFMVGIALEFSMIPNILNNRGQIMSLCFPVIAGQREVKDRVPEDPKAPFPFSMIERMMPLFPVIAVMGWMIVGISFLVGLLVLSPAQATFFSDAKAFREAATSGMPFVQANVTRHVIETWLPQFKFLGLGLGLMAITMALGTIAKRLRRMGFTITAHMARGLRPTMPPIPGRVRIFQLATVMGVMILMAALLVGLVLALGVVPNYWDHSIANELNPANPGSSLLGQLAVVSSFGFWLNPLRMVGMSFLFTGILIALSVIMKTLTIQSKLLGQFYTEATS